MELGRDLRALSKLAHEVFGENLPAAPLDMKTVPRAHSVLGDLRTTAIPTRQALPPRTRSLDTGRQQSQQGDPQEPIDGLLSDLETSTTGLSEREVARRIVVYGPNHLVRQRRRHCSQQYCAN